MKTVGSLGNHARTTVKIHAGDPVSEAGVHTHLRSRPEVCLVEGGDLSDDPQVTVMVADTVNEDVLVMQHKTKRTSTTRTVLIVADFTEQTVFRAVGCGVAGVVPRTEATPDQLGATLAARVLTEGGGFRGRRRAVCRDR